MSKKSYKISILILLIACCILVCCFTYKLGFKQTVEWNTVNYGATRDVSIPVNEDVIIKVRFTIMEDNFQGVSLNLSPVTSGFEDEELCFTLIDEKTGKEISQYKMLLKDEVSVSSSFAPLPFKNSANKKVSLLISGSNIKQIPYIYAAEGNAKGVELYINNVIKNNSILNFNVLYSTNYPYDLNILIGGFTIVILLIIIYFYYNIQLQTKEGLITTDNIFTKLDILFTKIYSTIIKYNKIFIILVFSFLYFALSLFVFKCYVEEYLEERTVTELVKENHQIENISLNNKNNSLEQTFVVKEDVLSTLNYNINVKNCQKNSFIHLKVENITKNVVYHDENINISELLKNNDSLWNVCLKQSIKDSINDKMKISIEAINFGKTVVTFSTGYSGNKLISRINQKITNISPALKVIYYDYSYLIPLYMIFIVIGYLFMCFIIYLFITKHFSITSMAIPITLFSGIIFMFLIPIYTVPDEYTHLDSAYIVSNRILGIEQPEEPEYEYKRAIDIETEEAPIYFATPESFRRMYTTLFKKASNTQLRKCYVKNAVNNAGTIFYIPAALGISIARLLQLDTYPMFMMGRLFNLLIYTLLLYFAIIKIPIGKELLLIVGTFPICLQEAASFSYDSIIYGISFVFIALCLRFMKQDEPISLIDTSILFVTLMMIASIKGGIYLPICFIIFLILFEQGKYGKKQICLSFCIVLLIILSFIKKNIVVLLQRVDTSQGPLINGFNGMKLYSPSYFIKNPMKLISIFANTFFEKSSEHFYEIFSGKLGSTYYVQIEWIFVIVIVFVVIALSQNTDTRKIITKKVSLLGLLIICISSILLIYLSMLLVDTTVNFNYIHGVQGRYFIPIMMPLLLLFSFTRKKQQKDTCIWMFIYYLNHIMIFFNVIIILFKT